MSVYGQGSLSSYGLAAPHLAEHREHDARAFARDVFWIVWIYSTDARLVWA